MAEEKDQRDRISPTQAIHAVDFLVQSDFSGLRRDTGDKTRLFGSLLGAVFTSAFAGSRVDPVGPPELQTRDVVGQDPALAERNLTAHGVAVERTEEFDPRKATPALLTRFPARLQAGDKVTLYTEGGRVKYYAIERPTRAADIRAEDVARLESDLSALRTEVRVIEAVRADLDRVKAAAEENQTHTGAELGALRDRLAQTEPVMAELGALRAQLAERDQAVSGLRAKLDEIQNQQSEFFRRVTPDMIARLRSDVDRLETFRKTAEPLLRRPPQ